MVDGAKIITFENCLSHFSRGETNVVLSIIPTHLGCILAFHIFANSHYVYGGSHTHTRTSVLQHGG